MKEKIKLAIFIAKNSSTSPGSINTALQLLENLDSDKYQISVITIDGVIPLKLTTPINKLRKSPSYTSFSKIKTNKKVSHIYALEQLTLLKLKDVAQFAIVAIYNTYGEDGKLIGLLETAGIPYLSPPLKTTAVCFDKTMTKALLRGSGINVPPGFEVHKNNYKLDDITQRINNEFSYPCIIKATSCGASWGVSRVNTVQGLKAAIQNAFSFGDECIVEKFLVGREFSVGISGHYLHPQVLPIVEIKTNNDFFDYEAKYVVGKAEEICPAKIPSALDKQIQSLTVDAYAAVKAESHARIDIIYAHNTLFVLEINTFPGLTINSIFPKELKAQGDSLSSFLDKSIATIRSKRPF